MGHHPPWYDKNEGSSHTYVVEAFALSRPSALADETTNREMLQIVSTKQQDSDTEACIVSGPWFGLQKEEDSVYVCGHCAKQ